jgi:hypothetical protein
MNGLGRKREPLSHRLERGDGGGRPDASRVESDVAQVISAGAVRAGGESESERQSGGSIRDSGGGAAPAAALHQRRRCRTHPFAAMFTSSLMTVAASLYVACGS